MKKISRLICALLCAALLLSASAFAAEDGFNASLTIDRSAAGQIRVTVADSSVLAAKKPSLTIHCEFAAAYVSFGGSVIASALDTEKKEISFPVAAGGTYVIQSGAAPSAPAAEVTVPVFSAAGKVDAFSLTCSRSEAMIVLASLVRLSTIVIRMPSIRRFGFIWRLTLEIELSSRLRPFVDR